MSEPKPNAREGLLTHDHSKRGRRYLSVLDPLHGRVTLLEPWEHAILVLCDGNHTARQILDVIDHPIEGEMVDLKAVQRTLKMLDGVKSVNVALVWEPYWTPERIDPRVRAVLGL